MCLVLKKVFLVEDMTKLEEWAFETGKVLGEQLLQQLSCSILQLTIEVGIIYHIL